MTQRLSFVPLEDMDPKMQAEMHRCAAHGTPRPESSAIRAHVPAAFWAFADSWDALFRNGVLDHTIKELCRVYISRTVVCECCGNQRSEKATNAGLQEAQYDELLNFEASDKYDDRQRAALRYAQAIAWGPSSIENTDMFWDELHNHFSEPELVELGCAIALTFGQQSWIRLLGISHHQYMAGSAGSMAPGYETPDAYQDATSAADYWAKA